MSKFLVSAIVAMLTLSTGTQAGESYNHCWSHYTGWEPWAYASEKGIVDKWAKKYGIEIKVTLINDYIESINLYTVGECNSVTATNMDALTLPAVGGIDTTAIVVGDYSNGNDAIVAKNAKSIKDLAGRDVRLVELSVSHYLLSRALEKNGMKERDLTVVNQSDADIAAVFIADKNGAVVTWNPPLQQALGHPKAEKLFDSSMIPGEIVDITFVKSDADERYKKALTGAWYEVMSIMSKGKEKKEALEFMAKFSGSTTPEFKAQLKTTAMFYSPKKASEFTKSKAFVETMDYVRKFSFDKGLFGLNAKSADFIGIQMGDGTVLGDKNNIKLRFTAKYMAAAASNTL